MNVSVENLLEKNSEALSGFINSNREKMGEVSSRLMDIEQKMARRPGGSGPLYDDGRSSGDGLGADILADAQFALLQSGRTKGAIFKFDKPFLTKATIMNSGQVLAQADRVSTIIAPQQRRLSIRSLLPIAKTTSSAVEFTRENVFSNAAAPQFSASPLETEGIRKAQSDISFTLVNVPVITVAHWTEASRQVLSDSAMLLDFIDTRLRYGLQLEEDDELLNGASGNGEVSGLLQSGNFTPYNRSSSADTQIDTLRRAFTQLELSNHTPSGVILNPTNWESISLLKDTQGRYLVGDPSAGNPAQLWGVPVVSTAAISAGTFLMADFANSVQLFERAEATIEIGFKDDDLIRNKITVLCEERIALAVFRPLGLVAGSL